jgi:protein-disulfide isomerase
LFFINLLKSGWMTLDNNQEDFLDEGNQENNGFSGGAVFGIGILMLVVGLAVGWLFSRPVNLPPPLNISEAAAGSNELQPERFSPPEEVSDALVSDPIQQIDNEAADFALPTNQQNIAYPTPTYIEPETRLTMGDPNAPVTIVEFSDYECPFCARHSQSTFLRLKQDYVDTGRVYYVFKDFPLTGLHPTAPRVHEAGQCVYELNGIDAYWNAHSIFFDTQSEWGGRLEQDQQDDVLVDLMEGIGVNGDELRTCLQENRYTAVVQADMEEGRQLGLTGTPSFFINGFPLVGALPYEIFEQMINLAESGELAQAIAVNEQQQQREQQERAAAELAANQPVSIDLGDAPSKGDPNAPVTIVEYSDYQCPFCARHATSTMLNLQQYIDAGQVYYIFKDFPLDSIHPQAQKAHEAARCSQELAGVEAYWQMHDILFINQSVWGSPIPPNHIEPIKGLAAEIGLTPAAFAECLDSGKYYDGVRAEVNEGIGFDITGTPTFFINGQRLVGAQPFEIFEQAILELTSEVQQ